MAVAWLVMDPSEVHNLKSAILNFETSKYDKIYNTSQIKLSQLWIFAQFIVGIVSDLHGFLCLSFSCLIFRYSDVILTDSIQQYKMQKVINLASAVV